jgi:Holliday junction resolvase RusA-like endonuclease
VKLEFEVADKDVVIAVRIPGEPQAWLRAGRRDGRLFNPKENMDARKHVQHIIRCKYPQFPDRMDCANRFGVGLIFETRMFDTDGDNYLKQALDALQNFVFKNDRQVDDYYVRVYRGSDAPNQQILVWKTLSAFAGRQI